MCDSTKNSKSCLKHKIYTFIYNILYILFMYIYVCIDLCLCVRARMCLCDSLMRVLKLELWRRQHHAVMTEG